jgi:hypothetical protein
MNNFDNNIVTVDESTPKTAYHRTPAVDDHRAEGALKGE